MNIRNFGLRFCAATARLSLLSCSTLLFLSPSNAVAQELQAHSTARPVAVASASQPETDKPAPVAVPAPQPTPAAPVAHLFATVQAPERTSQSVAAQRVSINATASATSLQPSALTQYTVTAENSQLEQRAFALINQARQAQGLQPLQWDADAAQLARAQSWQMATQGFFNHFDPAGRDVAGRAKELKIRGWRALGENIAYNRGFDHPADFAAERWLLSFGHKENIMRASFTHAALGVSRSAEGRIYFTQVFIER